MAEFLVYDKDNWMDSLTQEELDAHVVKDAHFMEKYDARWERGDIVEVREDGYWTSRKGHGAHAFALVVIPDMSEEEGEPYTKPDWSPGQVKLNKRRRFKMDMSGITLDGKKRSTLSTIQDAKIKDKSK